MPETGVSRLSLFVAALVILTFLPPVALDRFVDWRVPSVAPDQVIAAARQLLRRESAGNAV